jgi:hypothetical protein
LNNSLERFLLLFGHIHVLKNAHVVEVGKVEALLVRGLLAGSGKNVLDSSPLACVKVFHIKETGVGKHGQVESIGLDPEEGGDLSGLVLVQTECLEHIGLSIAFLAGVSKGFGHLFSSWCIEALIHKDRLNNEVSANKFGDGLIHACLSFI